VSRDPGVQNERTSLAWTRTALGLAGCTLLAGRLAIVRGSAVAVGLALAAAVLAVAVLGWSHDRYRRAERRLRAEEPVDFALPALVLTGAVGLVGLLSIALIVMP
jgi:uncharacterized membrane protein YidH (DUF202 family)